MPHQQPNPVNGKPTIDISKAEGELESYDSLKVQISNAMGRGILFTPVPFVYEEFKPSEHAAWGNRANVFRQRAHNLEVIDRLTPNLCDPKWFSLIEAAAKEPSLARQTAMVVELEREIKKYPEVEASLGKPLPPDVKASLDRSLELLDELMSPKGAEFMRDFMESHAHPRPYDSEDPYNQPPPVPRNRLQR